MTDIVARSICAKFKLLMNNARRSSLEEVALPLQCGPCNMTPYLPPPVYIFVRASPAARKARQTTVAAVIAPLATPILHAKTTG